MIYISAFVSFLLGDITMGLGRNVIVWSIAGLAVSLPIPFINAGQMVILYQTIPEEIQEKIFAVRNAITFCLRKLVGEGAGSGMAVMFLCTGILGTAFSLGFYRRKDIRKL